MHPNTPRYHILRKILPGIHLESTRNPPGNRHNSFDVVLRSRVIEDHWKHYMLRAWVISPTMVVPDCGPKLLRELSKVGIFSRAYADDVIIICRADDKEVLLALCDFHYKSRKNCVRRLNSQ